MSAKTEDKTAAVAAGSWETVESSDMITLLRQRVSDLEYQMDIKDLQIRNLLSERTINENS